jgi:hypothetical protein
LDEIADRQAGLIRHPDRRRFYRQGAAGHGCLRLAGQF